MTVISGVLINGFGEPMANTQLKAVATSTASAIVGAPAYAKTGTDGSYSFTLEIGSYSFNIWFDNLGWQYVGDIQILENTPNSSLDQLLVLPPSAQPMVLARVLQALIDAEEAAALASSQAALAEEARNGAESARDAAESIVDVNGTYPTIAAGLAATTSGQYFRVPQGENSDVSFIYYQNNSGTAVVVATLSSAFINQLIGKNDNKTLAAIIDKDGLSSLVVDEKGNIFAGGDSAQSVNEKADMVRQSRGPGIRRTSRADGTTFDLIDDYGQLYLPGMTVSVQRTFEKIRTRLSNLVKTKRVFDARDYGLSAFSSEDQWYALQRATLAAYAAGGGMVYIHTGAYRISRPITPMPGVGYIGPGKKLARLLPFKATAPFLYRGNETYIDNLLFSGFTIDGENQTLNPTSGYLPEIKAIFLQYWSNGIIDNMEIVNIGATGVGVDMHNNCIITRNTVVNCGRLAEEGALGASGLGIGTGFLASEPLFVSQNLCTDNTNYGIFYEPQRGVGTAQDIITTANVCLRNYAGIADCGVEGLIVADNELRENKHGFLMYPGTNNGGKPGRRGQLRGNVIRGNLVNGITSLCEKTDPLLGEYEFKDNKIYENAVDGVNFRYTVSTVKNQNNVIQANEIYRNGRHGIAFEKGDVINVDIMDNRIYNNGQTAPGNAIDITVPMSMSSITGNKIRDTQSVVTQQRPLAISGNLTDVDISNNHGCGNAQFGQLSGTQTRVNLNNNPGIFEVVA